LKIQNNLCRLVPFQIGVELRNKSVKSEHLCTLRVKSVLRMYTRRVTLIPTVHSEHYTYESKAFVRLTSSFGFWA
jgi:hypothetical protein